MALAEIPEGMLVRDEPTSHGSMALAASLASFSFKLLADHNG
jgi:hypothetical protein